ncbi:MAG: phage portal protein [Hyphomicrobiales bacterium]|nr:MAG: phage portal protein [Hyphomicrobiales bacterium]
MRFGRLQSRSNVFCRPLRIQLFRRQRRCGNGRKVVVRFDQHLLGLVAEASKRPSPPPQTQILNLSQPRARDRFHLQRAAAGAAREIALAFGVSPLLLGLPGDNAFANYSEANRAFWRQTVLPLVTRVQKSVQGWLQPAFEAFRFDYNADRLDALAAQRASEWERVGGAAFLTLDEQREALGYGPAPKDAFFAKRGNGFEARYAPPAARAGGLAQGWAVDEWRGWRRGRRYWKRLVARSGGGSTGAECRSEYCERRRDRKLYPTYRRLHC